MANSNSSLMETSSLRRVEERTHHVLRRVGQALGIPFDATDLNLGDISDVDREVEECGLLVSGARQVGIFVKKSPIDEVQIASILAEGFAVIAALEDGTFWVFENLVGSRIESSEITETVSVSLLRQSQVQSLLKRHPGARTFIAKQELECDSMSAARTPNDGHSHEGHAHGNGGGGHQDDPKPLRRFIAMLRLDQRDIFTVALFAIVAGVLALATPLAVESLVNVVSWGTYIQPLLVLALMLLACLGFAAVLSVLQTIVVEIIQRRQFVRIVGDLSHRFPRANQAALTGQYPRELANRVFDIMTIQKAGASLLLDGVSILLTTSMGLLLLAFYHPFLLGFDLVLLITMISATRLLGIGGVRTAIDESIVKYRVAHWLQDVLSTPAAFKVNGGEFLAIARANRLTSEYIAARQKQFRVVIRQVAFALGLQVVASTVLLGLGGWLVIRQQLTLGQLIASELVVTVVVGAFAKAGKTLEKFYDMMAGINKVGHLLDIPVDPRYELGELPPGPAEVRWEELHFHFASTNSSCSIPATGIEPGARVAVIGNDRSGKSLLVRSLAGLAKPDHGMAEISGFEAQRASLAGAGRMVGYAGRGEIFHASLAENVNLGRSDVGLNRVREVLGEVGLWNTILRLPNGVRTMLQTDGAPLSNTQQAQLIIARAMAGKPRLLLIDGLLDEMTMDVREHVWKVLSDPDAPWTLIIVTNHLEIAKLCPSRIELHGH